MLISTTNPTTVAYDSLVYSSFPDIIRLNSGVYLAVYREGDSHHPTWSRLNIIKSDDCITWTKICSFCASLEKQSYVFNCPKLSVVSGKIFLCCDTKTSINEKESSWKILLWESSNGIDFSPHIDTTINGMVPDRIITGKNCLIMGYHIIENIETKTRLVQMMAESYDGGKTWRDRKTICADNEHSFCEGSIVQIEPNKYICYMRDNKSATSRAYFSVSKDGCKTWNRPVKMNIMAHRIVAKVKKTEPHSGIIIGTFRNTITRSISLFVHNLNNERFQVFTLDTESKDSLWDFGYSGWVDTDDGSIMVIYYITRDKPNPEICLVNVELE